MRLMTILKYLTAGVFGIAAFFLGVSMFGTFILTCIMIIFAELNKYEH